MKTRVLLNIIATNKYLKFLDIITPTIESLFFPDCEVTILVHTNLDLSPEIQNNSRIKFVRNPIEHEPWPLTTLKRFHYFLSAGEQLKQNDYCFYIDADSAFIKTIDESILPPAGMIGTIHPCLFHGEGTPDRNPASTAYIPYGSGNRYFCGGFFGGKTEDFIHMSNSIRSNIDTDLMNGVMAVWHDESHINKWFHTHSPAVILDHPFASAETVAPPQENSHILFLDKNNLGGHDFFRTN